LEIVMLHLCRLACDVNRGLEGSSPEEEKESPMADWLRQSAGRSACRNCRLVV